VATDRFGKEVARMDLRSSAGNDDAVQKNPVVSSVADPRFLRVGALAAVLGFIVQFIASAEHPGHVPPNQSAAVFQEYAASDIWTIVHLGQFLGALLVALAFIFIGHSLPRSGAAGALALIGRTAAALWAAVFAVQMAVDGVALKATIDAWIAAPVADKPAAFLVAEAVRAIEKGLSSLFHLLNGTALLTLGLSVALGRSYPFWLGWFGIAAGIGYIAGGVVTAQTGFSPEAGQILGPALIPGVVFLFGMAIAMWRVAGSGDLSRHLVGQRAEAHQP